MPRTTIINAAARFSPALSQLTQTWYSRPTTTLWTDNNQTIHDFTTNVGTTQGCSLSAAVFALGFHSTILQLQQRLQQLSNTHQHQQTNINTITYAYLDDLYVGIPTHLVHEANTIVQDELHNAGLAINNTKTEYTTKGMPHADYAANYSNTFTILGSTPTHVNSAIDNGDLTPDHAGTPLTPQPDDSHLLQLQSRFYTRLLQLHQRQHITMQHAITLLRNAQRSPNNAGTILLMKYNDQFHHKNNSHHFKTIIITIPSIIPLLQSLYHHDSSI